MTTLGWFKADARAAVPRLLAHWRNRDGERRTRLPAGAALARIAPDDPTVAASFLEQLRSPMAADRRVSAEQLGEIHLTSAVGKLIAALDDPIGEVRAAAAEALGKMRSDPTIVVPALMKRLDDIDQSVRAATIRALGRFGRHSRAALPKIRAASRNDRYIVSSAADDALKDIRD